MSTFLSMTLTANGRALRVLFVDAAARRTVLAKLLYDGFLSVRKFPSDCRCALAQKQPGPQNTFSGLLLCVKASNLDAVICPNFQVYPVSCIPLHHGRTTLAGSIPYSLQATASQSRKWLAACSSHPWFSLA